MNQTLSDKIIKSATKVLEQWMKDNPEDSLLNLAQQLNYCALKIRTLGNQFETDYKKDLKGKTTNDLH